MFAKSEQFPKSIYSFAGVLGKDSPQNGYKTIEQFLPML